MNFIFNSPILWNSPILMAHVKKAQVMGINQNQVVHIKYVTNFEITNYFIHLWIFSFKLLPVNSSASITGRGCLENPWHMLLSFHLRICSLIFNESIKIWDNSSTLDIYFMSYRPLFFLSHFWDSLSNYKTTLAFLDTSSESNIKYIFFIW